MKIFHKGRQLFVFDYIIKKDGSIDVLICAPGYGKKWLNISRNAIIDNTPQDDGNNHYE